MIFCGQCGLQLASGTARCPRCGTIAEPSAETTGEVFQGDSPTVEATYIQRPWSAPQPQTALYPDASHTATPFTPPEQQKLILRPDNGRGFGLNNLSGNEQTSALNADEYRTNSTHVPMEVQARTQHTGYPNSMSYSSQPGVPYQNNTSAPPEYVPLGNVPPRGTVSSNYPPAPAKKRGGGKIIALLLCLLLVVIGTGLFAAQRAHLFGTPGGDVTTGNNSGTGGTTQNPTPAPTAQATALVQQYYTAVNNKEYPTAYNLWKWDGNGPTLAAFKQGYANTLHDDLTVKGSTQLADGTVKVTLNIIAKEHVNGATKFHTYAGYYIVGQDNGTWKIMRGVLNRIR